MGSENLAILLQKCHVCLTLVFFLSSCKKMTASDSMKMRDECGGCGTILMILVS